MSRSFRTACLILLATCGAVALRATSAADAPEPKPPADPDLNELLLRTLPLADESGGELTPGERPKGELLNKLRDKLRRAYPVRSLGDRLASETAGRKRLAKALPAAKLDFESEEPQAPAVRSVAAADGSLSWATESLMQPGSWSRGKALIDVHGRKVSDFVATAGFGFRRMTPCGSATGDRPRIASPSRSPGWSEADAGEMSSCRGPAPRPTPTPPTSSTVRTARRSRRSAASTR